MVESLSTAIEQRDLALLKAALTAADAWMGRQGSAAGAVQVRTPPLQSKRSWQVPAESMMGKGR